MNTNGLISVLLIDFFDFFFFFFPLEIGIGSRFRLLYMVSYEDTLCVLEFGGAVGLSSRSETSTGRDLSRLEDEGDGEAHQPRSSGGTIGPTGL